MYFCTFHKALKQKNYHNSPNIQPIKAYFEVLLKSKKRHFLATFSKPLNIFFLCSRHATLFFFMHYHMHCIYAFHLCVKYEQICIVRNAGFNNREFGLEDDLAGVCYTWYLSEKSIITQLQLYK